MTKLPPGVKCSAALTKQATCSSWVVRLLIVLKTRYASENSPGHPCLREIADGHVDLGAARLVPHARHHRLGQIDAVHLDAAARERERDTPCPDTEFERRTVAGKSGEDVDNGGDDTVVVHARCVGVVVCGDLLAEVPVVTHG